MGPEAVIERAIRKEAIAQGWLVRKLAFLDCRGAPDRIFGKGGRAVLIEFKAPGKVPDAQQLRRHRELREVFGLEVHVCDSPEAARELLRLRE